MGVVSIDTNAISVPLLTCSLALWILFTPNQGPPQRHQTRGHRRLGNLWEASTSLGGDIHHLLIASKLPLQILVDFFNVWELTARYERFMKSIQAKLNGTHVAHHNPCTLVAVGITNIHCSVDSQHEDTVKLKCFKWRYPEYTPGHLHPMKTTVSYSLSALRDLWKSGGTVVERTPTAMPCQPTYNYKIFIK